MRTIHKFPVKSAPFKVALPRGAKFLAVQTQHENPQMWFEVETDRPTQDRTFMIVGTGHSMPDDELLHLGTFQMQGGALVFHLYERIG